MARMGYHLLVVTTTVEVKFSDELSGTTLAENCPTTSRKDTAQ